MPRADASRRKPSTRSAARGRAAVALALGASLLGAAAPTSAQPAVDEPSDPAAELSALRAPSRFYPAPPALPRWVNPPTIEYEEGDPIPGGYVLATNASRPLVVGGLATWGSAYGFCLVFSTIALGADGNNEDFAPMLIPFAGPIITMTTTDAEGAAILWLAVNSALQTGGLILMAAGFANEDLYLRREVASAGRGVERALRPTFSIGPASAAVSFRF